MRYRSSFQALVLPALLVFASGLSAQSCTPGTNAALSFDGTDDWVRVPTSPALDGFGDFTIEAWARFDQSSAPEGQMIVSKWRAWAPSDLVKSYAIRRTASGALFIQFAIGAGPSIDRTVPVAIPDGQWTHLAVSRIGNQVNVYRDGVLVDAYTCSGTLNACPASFVVGGIVDENETLYLPNRFRGDIDELRIWSVGRTQAQIVGSLNATVPANVPGLVAAWRFDEAAGQMANSSGPIALSGTLGQSVSAEPGDPSWNPSPTTPLLYCPPPVPGQANSSLARLHVNGLGVGTSPGPFNVTIPTTGPEAGHVTLQWAGPPGSPLVLATGTLFSHWQGFPCTGSLDLFGPSLSIMFDGTSAPMSYFFTLNGTGAAFQAFTLPLPLPSGPLIAIQGGVIQPGCAAPIVLTAAFQLIL